MTQKKTVQAFFGIRDPRFEAQRRAYAKAGVKPKDSKRRMEVRD